MDVFHAILRKEINAFRDFSRMLAKVRAFLEALPREIFPKSGNVPN